MHSQTVRLCFVDRKGGSHTWKPHITVVRIMQVESMPKVKQVTILMASPFPHSNPLKDSGHKKFLCSSKLAPGILRRKMIEGRYVYVYVEDKWEIQDDPWAVTSGPKLSLNSEVLSLIHIVLCLIIILQHMGLELTTLDINDTLLL